MSEEKPTEEPAVNRMDYMPGPEKVGKKQCGELHKSQNAVCMLDKDHEGKHEAQFPSSGPHPSRMNWPKS